MPHFNKTLLNFQIQSFCFEHCRNSDNACGPGLYVSLGLCSQIFCTDSNNTFGFMRLFLCWLKSAICLNFNVADGHFCTRLPFEMCKLSTSTTNHLWKGKRNLTMTRNKIYISTHLSHPHLLLLRIWISEGSNLGSWRQWLDKETGRQLVFCLVSSKHCKLKTAKKIKEGNFSGTFFSAIFSFGRS